MPLLLSRDGHGGYLVLDGERQRQAMLLNAEARPERLHAQAVEAKVFGALGLDDDDRAWASLMANSRESLHPLDVAEAVAARLGASGRERLLAEGVSGEEQRRAQKLGLLPARVKQLWRAGALSEPAAHAFTAARDEASALALLDAPDAHFVLQSPLDIRRRLTAGSVEATHPRARFVGLEAYRDAGGEVSEDLLGRLTLGDAELLRRIERRKLEDSGKALCASEGWGRFFLDGEASPGQALVAMTAAEQDQGDALRRAEEDPEISPATLEAARRDWDHAVRRAFLREIQPADRHKYGVRVSYDTEGRLDVERGLILSARESSLQDSRVADPPAGNDDGAPRGGGRAREARSEDAAPPGEPVQTTEDGGRRTDEPELPPAARSETRKIAEKAASLAVAARIERDPDLALAVFVAGAVKAGWHVCPIRIERGHAHGGAGADGAFLRELAKQPFAGRLRALLVLDRETLLRFAAQLIAASVDLSRSGEADSRWLIEAAGATAAEIAEQFDYGKYFAVAGRHAALALLNQIGGEALERGHSWRGDDDLARKAAELAKIRGWVPEFLRSEARSQEPEARTEAPS